MRRDAYLECRVLAADPVELIHILYEHALVQVGLAREALAGGDVAGRARAVSKALAAFGELEGSLNYDAGGAISKNLGRLYQYMRKRLTEGNVKQSDKALAEVERLLKTLDDGWTAMQRAMYAPAARSQYHAVGDGEAFGNSWSA